MAWPAWSVVLLGMSVGALAEPQGPQLRHHHSHGSQAPLLWSKLTPGATLDPLASVLTQSVAERLTIAEGCANDTGAMSISVLWLLAHDSTLQVRMAALSSALRRCPKEPAGTCMALLRFFAEEKDAPGTWLARDALLHEGVAAAQEALTCDKLELVAQLTALLDRPQAPPSGRRALRLMAEDEDPQVQEAASAALLALDR